MPESSDDNKSSSSLINSLRSYRLKGRSQNPSTTCSSNSTNSNPVSQAPNSPSIPSEIVRNIVSLNQSNHLSKSSYSTSSTKDSQNSSSLNIKEFELSYTPQFVLPCILTKIQQILRKNNFQILSLSLSEEEYSKLREIVSGEPKLDKQWETCVSEKLDHIASGCVELKVSRQYVVDLRRKLHFILSKPHTVSDKTINSTKSTPQTNTVSLVKTYSRTPKKVPNIAETKATTLTSESPSHSNSSRAIMDEYEEFCEKEQNLRKLLDAYPGADIMEAQDILVKCNWNLKESLKTASLQPLRCKKRTNLNTAMSSSEKKSVEKNNEVNNNLQSTATIAVSSSKVAEEIILDSSDDELNNSMSKMNNKRSLGTGKLPAAKRARKLISSSESEDESSAAPINSKVESSAGSKTSTDFNSTSDPLKTFSASQSLTIKSVSSVSSEQSKKSIDSIPNLPKGLVITQLGSPTITKPASDAEKSNHKSSSFVNMTNQKAEIISISSSSLTEASNSKSGNSNNSKSGQLVKLKLSKNGVGSNHSDTAYSVHVTGSVVSMPSGSKAASCEAEKNSRDQGTSFKYKRAKSKRKKYAVSEDEDDDYGNEDIYDSEDSDIEENLTSAHNAVLKFFQEATVEELSSIPGCSKKKVEAIINLRPFSSWLDLVQKLNNDKTLSAELLNGGKKVLDMRNAINKLMAKCQQISMDMEDLVESLKENRENSTGYVAKQPDLLNENMCLAPYQMLGLNWLLLMHNQEVNAILADEMGLGKTVQAIAFLAYLKQIGEPGPHLIVVPSSTLDNWRQEFQIWWPTVSLLIYHGSQESRRELRIQILNDEVEEFDIMITTYNMVTSNAEDRSFFKRLDFCYVVFDEAHMLKNMSSQRYQNLMRVKAPRRLLLTGTPLQNNLVELMSLLIFAMPHMFSGKTEQVKQMFSCVSKSDGSKNSYEKDRIEHAKRIMKPFVLRRLKREVLQDLPKKLDEIRFCPMLEDQAKKYKALVEKFSAEVQKNKEDDSEKISSSGAGMMMQLRRAANHPLLLRHLFDDDKLLKMSHAILKEPTHSESNPDLVFEDMSLMSDFELHKLCKNFKTLNPFVLRDEHIIDSGKFHVLEELLPILLKEDHRILLFSQFTMVLDIIEEYMNIKKYKYMRLDGQTPVSERQDMIDKFNNDSSILIFLLSTRAGGLGINLTAADTVILHDIDFNPYNDKQAEDRCHRVGQKKEVRVIRFISENTIEEGILQSAKEKLKLERDIHEENEAEENDSASVAKLLRDALGLKNTSKS